MVGTGPYPPGNTHGACACVEGLEALPCLPTSRVVSTSWDLGRLDVGGDGPRVVSGRLVKSSVTSASTPHM